MVRVQLGFDIETFSGLTCGGFMCSFHSQPYSDLHRFNKITKNRKWTNVSCHLHVHFFFMTYIRFSHMQTDALLLCLNKATFLQEFFFLTHSVSTNQIGRRGDILKNWPYFGHYIANRDVWLADVSKADTLCSFTITITILLVWC